MTERTPNGLAALAAQRERAKRVMPPPRHPAAIGAHEIIEDRPGHEDNRPASAVDDPTAAADLADRPTPQPMQKDLATSTFLVTDATFKVTLYVDRTTDDFMEAARVAGLTARPKVDVSRSAVVRLALRRLMEEMTPAEVKSLLEAQPVRSGGPGRKRR